MAALPATSLVAVEEYLNSSYRPDREYVDGVLVERFGIECNGAGRLKPIVVP